MSDNVRKLLGDSLVEILAIPKHINLIKYLCFCHLKLSRAWTFSNAVVHTSCWSVGSGDTLPIKETTQNTLSIKETTQNFTYFGWEISVPSSAIHDQKYILVSLFMLCKSVTDFWCSLLVLWPMPHGFTFCMQQAVPSPNQWATTLAAILNFRQFICYFPAWNPEDCFFSPINENRWIPQQVWYSSCDQ